MRIVRLAVLCLVALAVTGSVQARSLAAPSAPDGLKAFLLRADEPAKHEFSRTPSFAWLPVRGAIRYEFELSKNSEFTEAGIFWSDEKLKVPAVSIPLALPWLTGSPYAVYARVRAITATGGVTGWSTPYGFNVRWGNTPLQLPSSPGMSRWSVVEGATSYHVWFTDVRPGKVVATKTNAVDHREFYAFHQQPGYTGTVRFRVRAVRNLYGAIPTGLPAVSHGPWSPIYTSANPAAETTGVLTPQFALSDTTTSTPTAASLHRLTPAFAFSGTTAGDARPYEFYRVYVFSDKDCVNTIFRSSMVASPAFVPRLTGPLKLPKTNTELSTARNRILPDGNEPPSYTADGLGIQSTEQDKKPAAPTAPAPAPGTLPDEVDPASVPPAADTNLPATPVATGAPVDLWESGWPNGRFYWTVVPVYYVADDGFPVALTAAASAGTTTITVDAPGFTAGSAVVGTGAGSETVTVGSVSGATLTLTTPLTKSHVAAESVTPTTGVLKYYDAETPQDACAAGRVLEFGKTSEPALSRSGSPFASGLSPRGLLTAAASAKPSFYGTPLVAWVPALGADQYQVQWSKTSYPWRKEGEKLTYATSALLPLEPGKWFYRVRGINFSLPGTARAMTWSAPVGLSVSRPTFAVVKKSGR
jgi:hypothetical protein